MTSDTRSKINQLVSTNKRGSVLLASCLRKKGFSYELLNSYQKSGWLVSLGYGAYKLCGDEVDWAGALWALQTQAGIKVHIGGKAALELQGYSHFVRHDLPSLDLFAENKEKLPRWFCNYNWGPKLRFSTAKLFASHVQGSLSKYEKNGLSVTISCPERAAMEMLYFVPDEQSFSEAFLITENLSTLRPLLVQSLLEVCNSIKVKRIFLSTANQHDYPWFRKLNTEKISLGAGKREIVKGGVLDKKYLITVPAENYAR
jgi:hypothetical protein